MADHPPPLCRFDATSIHVRDRDLCGDLIGGASFSQFLFYLILGRWPSSAEVRVVDACLIAIAEHGFSPGATVTRLTYMGAPESMQGAVAAGLLGVGDQFVGTVELTAPLLEEMVAATGDPGDAARAIVARYRERKAFVPGFGQPHHKPDDPRPAAIFAVADAAGASGPHIAALRALSTAVDALSGRHVTINAPGAIAAALLDLDVPVRIMRGFMLIARCAGLVAHIAEEQQAPLGRALWDGAAARAGGGH